MNAVGRQTELQGFSVKHLRGPEIENDFGPRRKSEFKFGFYALISVQLRPGVPLLVEIQPKF